MTTNPSNEVDLGGLVNAKAGSQHSEAKSLTLPWLRGAHYRHNPAAILPYLDVYVPNSATHKEYRYRGAKQCDLIQCLLDALGIPGETELRTSIRLSQQLPPTVSQKGLSQNATTAPQQ